ncbi:amidase [Ilumatobacter sp.]|uniref:amidase n=1 Tax=Ilumatobacter sp. TaxID=1967498 RepID=UPI003C6F8CF2
MVLEASIVELQEAMSSGAFDSRRLTAGYLARIEEIDRSGPTLNSVIEVNPDADEIAAALDRERAVDGPRGPLHGIPVLLKDNIATGDRMQTTAGSTALIGSPAVRDASLVTRLRDAGAVILGKTNLSEWANIRSSRSTSGWSARGGLTRNPYALDRNTSGSSSGSAVAVAASLCAVAVGTETDGSIVSPASVNGLVGIKPTVGAVSRDGIIPISHSQDTAGPMGRTVADAAALLAALVEPGSAGSGVDELGTDALGSASLAGSRLGVLRNHDGAHPGVDALFEAHVETLRRAGAVLVDPVELEHGDEIERCEFPVLLHELKFGLERWFAEFAPSCGIGSLADLIAWNRHHAETELRWFGQELFEAAGDLPGLDDPEYLEMLATCRRASQTDGIDAVLAAHDLDALVAPTGGPAWMTDLVNGDNDTGSCSTPAAVAGYPHVTVPMGQVGGLPVGWSFIGDAGSDARMVRFAAAFERLVQGRTPPTYAASVAARG